MKHRITAALERFSRAMLAPLSYLSAAGLLLVVGVLLTSAPLAGVLPFLRWEPVQLAGRIIYKCLTAVISNLSVLFCTGLAAALAKREKHQAAFIALMSYLVYLTAGNVTLTELGLLAQPDALTGLYSAGQTMVLGIQTVDTGVFGGILLGLLTAFVYDRTCEKAHRGILGGVFSGVRWSFACMAALAAVLGFGALSGRLSRRPLRPSPASLPLPAISGCFCTAFWNGCSSLQGCIIWCICRSSSRS
jgi:PTS system maltose and glucose-specific IIC component